MAWVIGALLVFLTLAVVIAATAKIVTEFAASVRDTIGRKQAGRKPSIPEQLLPSSKTFPIDHERSYFVSYRPRAPSSKPLGAIKYEGDIEYLFSPAPPPALSELATEDIERILKIGPRPSYLAVFEEGSERPTYPVPKPEMPAIDRPPAWKPWKVTSDEPTFEPPYYSGILRVLNPIVRAAHANEFAALLAARRRRDLLEFEAEERNGALAKLASEAKSRYDTAMETATGEWKKRVEDYQRHASEYIAAAVKDQTRLHALEGQMQEPGAPGLLSRIEVMMKCIELPTAIWKLGKTKFDAETGILIHEHQFPDLQGITWVKWVPAPKRKRSNLGTWGASQDVEMVKRPATQKEAKEAARALYPALCLRLLVELARLDKEGIVTAVAVNGWAEFTETTTGQQKTAYCASVFARKEQIAALNVASIEPVAGFNYLKGVVSPSLEVTPIAPIIRLDTSDPRFVEAREILAKLETGENLATMPWEDFEHLCRELFERAFASVGAEVKVTQASRDQGVDAIVFDPDPLRGGKIVIQAKRYTNVVDAAAIRELYGTVLAEGATKGILVTTSHFGADSYAFAKDKPLTLLSGKELLGLLEQHGYRFRINIAEARTLASA